MTLNRFRALLYTTGDFIAILNDDQYVDSHWLLFLYNTLVAYHADVAFGAVILIFESGASVLVRKSNTYGIVNFSEGFSEEMIFHIGNCCFRINLKVSKSHKV